MAHAGAQTPPDPQTSQVGSPGGGDSMPVLQGPPNRACYKHTCAIQRCLSESNYDTRACQWAVDALKRCCEHDFAVGSIHCAFPDLKRRQQKATQEIERKQPQVGDDDKEKNGIGGQEKATA